MWVEKGFSLDFLVGFPSEFLCIVLLCVNRIENKRKQQQTNKQKTPKTKHAELNKEVWNNIYETGIFSACLFTF